jgi:hypothetical protein
MNIDLLILLFCQRFFDAGKQNDYKLNIWQLFKEKEK